jgi:Family of unknown function (DUF6069)
MSTTDSAVPRSSTPAATRIRTRAITVAAAVLAAIIVWVIEVPVAGIDLVVQPVGAATQQVGFGSVLAMSLTASLLGWALLALLERIRPADARTMWTVTAVVVFALSLFGPLTGGSTLLVGLALVVMHVVVAAVLIVGMRRSTGPGPAATPAANRKA